MSREYEELRFQIEDLERKARELQEAIAQKQVEFQDLLARVKALGEKAPPATEWKGVKGSLGDIAGTISDKLS